MARTRFRPNRHPRKPVPLADARRNLSCSEVQLRNLEQAERDFIAAAKDADQAKRTRRGFWVYVIELDDDVGDPGEADLPWLYVGQTVKTPFERYEQHRSGVRASRWVKNHWVELRPDLYSGQPVLRTRSESEAYERWLAEWFRATGRAVKGGT